jgi:hypothetical protein
LVALLGVGLIAVAAVPAAGADFSPRTRFSLSAREVRANPTLKVVLRQEAGEEELARVTLKLPAGFSLPRDRAIVNGEAIGSGQIVIASGPGCAGAAGTAPVEAPVRIVERDRTPAERARGVVAVWVVDLRPVTQVDLLVRGSASRGWRLSGEIPQNRLTCPPFQFRATIQRKSSVSKTPILRNPSVPGVYVFRAIYRSTEGSNDATSQRIRIAT